MGHDGLGTRSAPAARLVRRAHRSTRLLPRISVATRSLALELSKAVESNSAAHDLLEQLSGDWLRQIPKGSILDRLDGAVDVGRRAHQHDREIEIGLSDKTQEISSSQPRHHDVAKNGIEPVRGEKLECLRAVPGCPDLVPISGQESDQGAQYVLVILHNQHLAGARYPSKVCVEHMATGRPRCTWCSSKDFEPSSASRLPSCPWATPGLLWDAIGVSSKVTSVCPTRSDAPDTRPASRPSSA